ncbi:MAG TPA: SPOR domain-containing protein [Pseudomonadales bacterium]
MKQRLVGTLVLGSLALILIPLLLDGEGVERPPLSANAPPAPVIDTTPLPEPTRPEIVADAGVPPDDEAFLNSDLLPEPADQSAETEADTPVIAEQPPEPAAIADSDTVAMAAAPAVTVAEAEAEVEVAPEPEPPSRSITEPALDASGLPETWAVRVGVFGNASNARRLEERLKADDYKAFVRPLGVSSAVYIGPLTTRDEAVAIQQKLNAAKSAYQIDGVSVQRFDIGQQ